MQDPSNTPPTPEQRERRAKPTTRKPFVLPQLRREAELTKRTADRIFTFHHTES